MIWTRQYTRLFAGMTIAALAAACSDGSSSASNDESMTDAGEQGADESGSTDDRADASSAESPPGSGDADAPSSGQDGDDETNDVGKIVDVAGAAGTFDTLITAAEAAGLVDALSGEGPLTVFAPTDAAFAALPEGALEALLADPEELTAVLSYHVVAERVTSADIDDGTEVDTLLGPWLTASVDESGVSIGSATVTSADINADNGVIHVIDRVLLPPPAIFDLAADTDELSTLTTALQAAGLDTTLNGEGPFTVFAPTDAAFEALPEGVLDALLADRDALASVLLYHVLDGQQRAADVVALDSVETLGAERAEITVDGGSVRIAGAEIQVTDIAARNGVVHLLDRVMLPPNLQLDTEVNTDGGGPSTNLIETAIAAGNFDTLVAAVEVAGLGEALSGEGPFTLFAPTDEAFEALPEGVLDALLADPEELAAVLQYHVVAGAILSSEIADEARVDTLLGPWLTAAVAEDGVSIGDASVIAADVEASNGIIHVIDRVLIPPSTIAEIAASNPELSTLVIAIEAAGLVETLSSPGQLTVFAPTNAAFDALPAGTLEALLEDEEALRNVLLYHVIGSRQPASSVVEASAFEMLSGQSASVQLVDANVFVGGARVVATDIVARNGVIHIVGDVMLPPGM